MVGKKYKGFLGTDGPLKILDGYRDTGHCVWEEVVMLMLLRHAVEVEYVGTAALSL